MHSTTVENTSLPITGSCFCKQLHYSINQPIEKMGVCHCHSCQKLTGGLALPFMAVSEAGIAITGQSTQFARKALSGKQASFYFCPHCGTSVFGKPELLPGVVIVSASTLDDQNHFSPKAHIWTNDAPAWAVFDGEIPYFPEYPPESS